MRVLFLNPGGHAQGGAERSLAALIEGLSERGHQCFVIVMADGDASPRFRHAGATVLPVASGVELDVANRHAGPVRFITGAASALPRVLRLGRDITRCVTANRIDLVHSNGFRSHIVSAALSTDVPVVWSLRDRAPRRLHRSLLRLAGRRCDLVIANSSFTGDQLADTPIRTVVVGNPVDAPGVDDRTTARRALGLPLDAPVVGMLAHLHPSKGHDVALDAVAALPPGKRPTLAIAGGDLYSTSSAYRASLTRRARDLGIAEKVVMVGNLDEPGCLYAAADVIAHPCRHPEGFGRVIVEAQLAGRPVVATGLGGVLDLIDDERNGLLVPPDAAGALADAIDRILGDELLRARLTREGFTSGSRFDAQRHVTAVEALYEQLLDRPAVGSVRSLPG